MTDHYTQIERTEADLRIRMHAVKEKVDQLCEQLEVDASKRIRQQLRDDIRGLR